MSELEQVTQYVQGIVIAWIGVTCTIMANSISGANQFTLYSGFALGFGLILFGNFQISKNPLKKLPGKEIVAIVKKYKLSLLSSILACLLAIIAAVAMYKFANFPTWLLAINVFSVFLGFTIIAQWIHLLNLRKTK